MNDLIEWIQKAAALAGKMGNANLQAKLLQLASDAERWYTAQETARENPQAPAPEQRNGGNNGEMRKVIANALREVSLDPEERKRGREYFSN